MPISHAPTFTNVCKNPGLSELVQQNGDLLFHFGFGTHIHDFKKFFGDVRYIVMGGSEGRMKNMAHLLRKKFQLDDSAKLENIATGGRYVMYKVGPVLCVNHNIGASTLSVVLHEMLKLCDHACIPREAIHIIRIGTSGGIGITPGDVIISHKAIDSLMNDHFQSAECGKLVPLKMKLDQDAAHELKNLADEMNMPNVLGGTMGTDDFYLGQGRLDGAFISYNQDDKFDFLRRLHNDYGIRNIEMEAHILSAFTHRAGVKCSIVCVAIVNRLGGDLILASEKTLRCWERAPCELVAEYIRRKCMS